MDYRPEDYQWVLAGAAVIALSVTSFFWADAYPWSIFGVIVGMAWIAISLTGFGRRD